MADTAGVLLVHGEEPQLVDATVAAWRAAIGGGDLEVIDAPARLEPLIASLVDMPLLAAERHLLVRDLPQLSGARRGALGVDELIHALAVRSPTTHVCFAVRATVTPANPILAAIAGGGGQVVHHERMRPADRRRWLDAELGARGLRLAPGGADLLLRCTAGDLAAIAGELDKIAAYGGQPTIEELELLVAGAEQLELYRVLDLLAGQRPARGAALLIDLIAEGRSTQYLLSILAGQIRDLLMAHALLLRGQGGAAAMAASMRMPAWRADRVLRTAQSIPATLAMAWMRELQGIDAGLKAGEVDDAAALQRWGLAAAESLGARRERRSA
ncbi:MAG: DNA polymerase III subunit delta [Candidatus Dormibacteria bacterium]